MYSTVSIVDDVGHRLGKICSVSVGHRSKFFWNQLNHCKDMAVLQLSRWRQSSII